MAEENPNIKSCFNYTGGKFKILSKIKPHFPEKIKYFLDPFCGGLNISLNVESEITIANDIDKEIICFYNVVKELPKEYLIENINSIAERYHATSKNKLISKDDFLLLREEFNVTKNPLLLPVLAGVSFSNTIRYNSSGLYNASCGKRNLPVNWFTRFDSFMTRLKSKNIIFESMDFSVMDKYVSMFPDKENIFAYFDPPYSITDASYNRFWVPGSDLKLFNWIDDNLSNSKFAMSNVIENKGKYNHALKKWVDDNEYNMIYIENDYRNSIVGKPKLENYSETKEVLIKNY